MIPEKLKKGDEIRVIAPARSMVILGEDCIQIAKNRLEELGFKVTFGKYVMEVHAKDGMYPTNGKELGNEVKIGVGKVNFPAFISKLKEIGFDGNLIIEREITGEQQSRDILESKEYLESLV